MQEVKRSLLLSRFFGAIAHFERRLIAARTKDGIAAARARANCRGGGHSIPKKAKAALSLVVAGMSPTDAARQLGLGRATVYREMASAGVRRSG